MVEKCDRTNTCVWGRIPAVVLLNNLMCMAHWSFYDNSRTTERVENRDLFMIIVGPPRGSRTVIIVGPKRSLV